MAGENVKVLIALPLPKVKFLIGFFASTSIIEIIPFANPAAIKLPSLENATLLT